MIHPTAIISETAELGTDVKIGPYVIIEDYAEIGDESVIDAHAVIRSGARIGKSVTVDCHSVIAGLPQDLGFDPSIHSFAEIGDGTRIREGCTVNRSTKVNGSTIVGKNCYLMAQAHVGHDCLVGDRVIIGNTSLLAGHVTVGDDTFLGGDSGIHQYCRIGYGVMFGGDSTATVDVPPFTMLSERNSLFGLNLIGLKRRGHTMEAIRSLKFCYREIFASIGRKSEAAKTLMEAPEAQTEEAKLFLSFFLEGKRGFARPRKS